ncbi:hypothetical protein ACFE04_010422 [Oxalis oulophora]
MKKYKGVVHLSSSGYDYEDPRVRFKYANLMKDYQDLQKETEAKRKRLEMMRQKKLTLLAEVRFLRKRHQQLTQSQSFKPEPVHSSGIIRKRNNTSKGRNNHGKEASLPPLVPRSNLKGKGKIYNGKESAWQSSTTLSFDLNQKQRTSKDIVSRNSFPVIDLNQNERVYSGEATTHAITPVFDLNQISVEVEEELEANGEPTRSEDLKRSLIRAGSDEQLNEMKLSACRTIGNGPSRAGKRKLSWLDQMALRV